MQHFLKDGTIGLSIGHQISTDGREYIVIARMTVDPGKVVSRLGKRGYSMFLRLFPDLVLDQHQELAFYLDEGMINWMSKKTGLIFEAEMEASGNVCFANSLEVRDDFKISFSSLDVLNYIYGVLHTTTYNKEHKDFLKMNPPGLPYPKDSAAFWESVKLGKKSDD